MDTKKHGYAIIAAVVAALVIVYLLSLATPSAPNPDVPSAPPTPSMGIPTTTPPGMVPGGSVPVLTEANNGGSITVRTGERVLVKLGDTLSWTVTISDPSVLARVKNVLVIRGAQGLYDALKPGTVTVVAEGRPICKPGEMCAQFIQRFSAQVVVE